MHQEAHQASGNDGVANPDVPVHPSLLEEVERSDVRALIEVSTPKRSNGRGSSHGSIHAIGSSATEAAEAWQVRREDVHTRQA